MTVCSCMTSSRADCVFGEARLISSPRTMLAKTGPGRKLKVEVAWSKTDTPVTSEGSRSGVNWMRFQVERDRRRDGPGQRRLAHARHVLDQQVALGQRRS